VKNANISGGNSFSDKMQVNFHMFSALMLHGISGEIDRTYVITINQRSGTNGRVKLHEKLTQPGDLSNSISNGTIFSFSTRTGDGALTLGRPGDQVITKKHNIARSGTTGIWTTGPVRISVNCHSTS
jgi:hypothetical protein